MPTDHATIYVDIETGGVDRNHPVIQVAAAAFRGREEVESFERKLRFNASACDPDALKMNSYDRETWAHHAVEPAVAVADLAAFTRRYATLKLTSKRGRPYTAAKVGGYNCATFDFPRLRRLVDDHGVWWPARWWYPLDVYHRVIWWFEENDDRKEPENYQLPTVAAYFGIETDDAHDALADVRITAAVAARVCSPVMDPTNPFA